MAVTQFEFRLEPRSGVPVYRQLIEQVLIAVAAGTLRAGDQLPTVRQLAVDLSINPNTVVRAYKELEIRGFLATQQGTGTFITSQPVQQDEVRRQERLSRSVAEFVARMAADGYTVAEITERLAELSGGAEDQRS